MDVDIHSNNTASLIKSLQDWLNVDPGSGAHLPGSTAIAGDYAAFQLLVPDISELRLNTFDALPHSD